jgi:hypothetical protein
MAAGGTLAICDRRFRRARLRRAERAAVPA